MAGGRRTDARRPGGEPPGRRGSRHYPQWVALLLNEACEELGPLVRLLTPVTEMHRPAAEMLTGPAYRYVRIHGRSSWSGFSWLAP